MTSSTPAATAAQLARAAVIGKALRRRGWTSCDDQRDKHPGAQRATVWTQTTTPDLTLLILTIGGKNGQIAELLHPALAVPVRGRSDRTRAARRPSWRLTCYDAPPLAVTSAALAAADAPPDGNSLTEAGWNTTHHQADDRRRPILTEFTRPDGAVSAAFRLPTFTPPCERCPAGSDLGDAGGWLISGPGFTADATAHIPGAVITAFALALPGGEQPISAPRRVSTTSPKQREMR
jgi:hypothetical protein